MIYYAAIIKVPSDDGHKVTLEEALERGRNATEKVFGEIGPHVWPIMLPEKEEPCPNILKYQRVKNGEPAIMLRGTIPGGYPMGKEEEKRAEELETKIDKIREELGQNKSYHFYSPDGFEGPQGSLQRRTEHVRLYNLYSIYTLYHPVPLESMIADGTFVAPSTGKIYPAIISYYSTVPTDHDLRPAITLAFQDKGKTLNAKEIAQALWGPDADGDAGAAWSPIGEKYTQEQVLEAMDFVEDLERLKELENKIEQFNPTGRDALSDFRTMCYEAKMLGEKLYQEHPEISILKKYGPEYGKSADQPEGK